MRNLGRKFLIAFALWVVFAFSLLQFITITVAWWNGDLTAGPWEWLWIGQLPVWLFVFFRYYSIFRPGCRACLPSDEKSWITPKQAEGTAMSTPMNVRTSAAGLYSYVRTSAAGLPS